MRKTLVALALAPLAVAACGNENEDYVKKVNAAQDRLGEVVSSTAGDVAPGSGKKAAPVFRREAAALRKLASDIRAVKAPKELANGNRQLAAGIDAYAKVVDRATDDTPTQFSRETQAALTQVAAEIDQINRKVRR